MMMRAAVFTGNGGLEIVEHERPEPGPGEVRVRLQGSGVCASNLPVWEGRPWFQYPLRAGAPGHEGWGVVDAVGAGSDSAWLGRRVAFLSSHAYAEWDVTSDTNLARIPDNLSAEACPGEPLACAVNVIRRARVHPQDTVIVIGIGFLGALLVRLAVERGARVIAISRRRFALDLARQLGAEESIPLDGASPAYAVDEVSRLTEGKMSSCVIEATGHQESLDLATELTGTRGRLVIAGYHQDGPRQVNMQVWNWRGLDVINAHERDEGVYVQGMRKAFRLMSRGGLPVGSLLTHSVPLDRLGEAFQLMRERPDGFLKACVRFEESVS